ncbi:MAG: hypothetical protein QNJ51_17350 [Calothrix sp. MO_167.B12]|nr:hypothetical protein [Calothrix sp. MO_167.B12]
MRYLLFGFFLPCCFFPIFGNSVVAQSQSPSSRNHHLSSRVDASFYTAASRLIQQQINLLARMEMALVEPDPNPMRVVRGRLLLQTKAVERFLKHRYTDQKPVCDRSVNASFDTLESSKILNESQRRIYCSLSASNRELLKLTPVVDRLLSRRGELAWVRDLPLVSGERQSHPVLSIAPIKRPRLGESATPFSTKSSYSSSSTPAAIGGNRKTVIANYITPMAPAIAPPPEVLKILQSARALLMPAKAAFPEGTKFVDPRQVAAFNDRRSFGIEPQEKQTYAQFLAKPQTGIFRVLPVGVTQQDNGWENRLQPNVRQRYPFPSLGKTNNGFTPNLALQIVDDKFAMLNQGADYSFMVDMGDITLDKIGDRLKKITHPQKDFLLNYQPPQKLEQLQIHRRRFLTGKQSNWHQTQPILAEVPVKLNHTYLMRSLQFQLPEIITSGKLVSSRQRLYIDQLLEMQSSDVIVAFRPVRRRADGSYTILWRVFKQLPNPQIHDLEDYLKIEQ